MYVKSFSPDLLEGLGIENEETEELEMLFEDHDVYARVRELQMSSSRFWIFELGAWSEEDPGEIVCRSTPFVPLGDDIDEAAKLIQLMITHVATDHNLPIWKRGASPRSFHGLEIENQNMLTGQRWVEFAEFGDEPPTQTEPSSEEEVKN